MKQAIKQELFEIGKMPPHSLELESAVLGAAMLEKESLEVAIKLLKEEVFYTTINKTIFKAISRIYFSKGTVDILTVTQEIVKLKEIQNVSAYHISSLTNKVAGSSNTEYHCRILLELFFKREVIRIATKAIAGGYDEYKDVFDLKDTLVNELKNIDSFVQSDNISDNNQTIDNVLTDIKLARDKGGIIGYSTGIKNLDWAIMGLSPKMKYVICALPAMGKSSLAKSIGISLAYHQNVPGVFFSLEMPKEMLMRVCISEILQIPNTTLQRGETSEHDEKRIKELKNTLFASNFLIDDRHGLSPNEIRATLIRLKEKYNIKWFVIDYLRLMRLKGKEHKGKNTDGILSDITADLKNTAKELDLICIELSQMNKEGSKRSNPRPILTDIRDSGSIEMNADVVIFPYRPEKIGVLIAGEQEDTGHTELIIAKNRFGPLKTVAARFKHEFTQFVNNDDGVELDTRTESESTPSF